MYCPSCRAEYRENFSRCNDCNLPLVDALPPEPKLVYQELVEAVTVVDFAKIPLIKSILESEGIQYFIQGEHHNSLFGLRVVPMRVLVPKDQLEEARDLINDL